MTDRTSALLDSIDGALRDWDTSGDAMRWVPEKLRAEAPSPPAVEIVFEIDWAPFARACEEAAAGLARLFADLGTAVGSGAAAIARLAPAFAEARETRRREFSVMRSEYRRRGLARRRRRR